MRGFTLLNVLVGAAAAAPLSISNEARSMSSSTLYFLENEAEANYIVAFPVPSGSSTSVPTYSRTLTGGKGLRGRSGTMASGPDSLFGQSAVFVSQEDKCLFTVNPGSNTVSMFQLESSKPLEPMLMGTASSYGDFPMSVTYSSALKTACVLNGGEQAGVACYKVTSKGLTPLSETLRPLPSSFKQSTPPMGPPGTTSQIGFSPDNTMLIATIKGMFTASPPMAGYTSVWSIEDGKIAEQAVSSSFNDTLAPFGFGFINNAKTLLVSDPTHGATVQKIGSNYMAKELSVIKLANFSASCWAANSPDYKTGYVIDAGSLQIAMINSDSYMVEKILELPKMAKSGFDTVVTNDAMYVLAQTAGVAMYNIMSEAWTFFDLGSVGMRANWQGLALFSS